MKLLSKYDLTPCLLAAFAVAWLGFSAVPCHAQEKGRLLHAGLLGYAGGIEDEALLLSPTAFSQFNIGRNIKNSGAGEASDQMKANFHFRLGHFHFRHDSIGDSLNGVPFFGISGTHPLNDYLAVRGSIDLGFADDLDLDEFVMPIKFTLLAYPLAGYDLGRLKPYLGVGWEHDYYTGIQGANPNVNQIASIGHWELGAHFLVGADYYFDGFSLGLEISWSYIEPDIDLLGLGPDLLGGVSYLFNVGIYF